MSLNLVKFTGNRLRETRKAQGMSKAAAARHAGVDRRCWYRYEDGECAMPSDALFRFARAVNIDLDDLFPESVPELIAQAA